MNWILQRTVAPTAALVTLDEAKAQCRIRHSSQDTLLAGIILAAVDHVERIGNIALLPQTWKVFYDSFPAGGYLQLPRGPVISVTHLKYTNSAGTQTTWDSGNYVLNLQRRPARLTTGYTITYPSAILQPGLPIEVQFVAGYANAAAVPASIKQAVLLLIDHWYQNPSAVTDKATSTPIAFGVDALIRPYRVPAF